MSFGTLSVIENGASWLKPPVAEVDSRHTSWDFPEDEAADAVEMLRFVTPFKQNLEAFVDVTPYSPLLRAAADTYNQLTVYSFIDTWVGNNSKVTVYDINPEQQTCTQHEDMRPSVFGNGWELYADLVFFTKPETVDTRPRASLTLGAGTFSMYHVGGIETHEGEMTHLQKVKPTKPFSLTGVQEIEVYDCPRGTRDLKGDVNLLSLAKRAIELGLSHQTDELKRLAHDFRVSRVEERCVQVEVVEQQESALAHAGQRAPTDEERTIKARVFDLDQKNVHLEVDMPVYLPADRMEMEGDATHKSVGKLKTVNKDGTVDISLTVPCALATATRLLVPKNNQVVKEAAKLAEQIMNIGHGDHAVVSMIQGIDQANRSRGPPGLQPEEIEGLAVELHAQELAADKITWMPEMIAARKNGSKVVPMIPIGRIDLSNLPELPEELRLQAAAPLENTTENTKLVQLGSHESHETPPRRVCLVSRQVSGPFLERSFSPPEVKVGEVALMQLSITGHGWDGSTQECGEFCEMHYTISFGGKVFKTLTFWRNDCSSNPDSDQYGTWQFPRNGWCPGSVEPGIYVDMTEALKEAGPGDMKFGISVKVKSSTGEFTDYTDFAQIMGHDPAFLFIGLTIFIYDAEAVIAVRAQTHAYSDAELAIRQGSSDPSKIIEEHGQPQQQEPQTHARQGGTAGAADGSDGGKVFFQGNQWYPLKQEVRSLLEEAAKETRVAPSPAPEAAESTVSTSSVTEAWIVQHTESAGDTSVSTSDSWTKEATVSSIATTQNGGGGGSSDRGDDRPIVIVPLLGAKGLLFQGTAEGRLHRTPVEKKALPADWMQVGLHLRLGRPHGDLRRDHYDRVASIGLVLPPHSASSSRGESAAAADSKQQDAATTEA